ncbi:MAG: homocysteine S-methyltransferase family protein [Candidatus Omnitrophica bacterium]|nr:homocysteine S-methyltransferase family protein [Candidatus Omnitrophota bacterium]
MKDIKKRLIREVLVCDGAMGTMLMQNGMPEGECPDYWGMVNHKKLLDIHKSYIQAGADMITTNTFGSNWLKLKRFSLQDKVRQINTISAELARQAARDKAYVLGDIGPSGEYIKPVGDIEFDQMYNIFAEQARTLEDARVDLILLETFYDMQELNCAILAVKDNTKLPVIASMTFQRLKDKSFKTTSGINIACFVEQAVKAGADIIGSNCTVTGIDMADIVLGIKEQKASAIIAQPNAGMPRMESDRIVYDETAECFGKHTISLIEKGANIIGGCCGTTPEHIKSVRRAVDAHKRP